MAFLQVLHGDDAGRRFALEQPITTIGRDSGNLIRLRDSEVSRRHGEILQTPEGFELVDLASSNGTFLDRERIDRCLLRDGDRIRVGRTWLVFGEDAPALADQGDVEIVPDRTDPDASRIVARAPAIQDAFAPLDAEPASSTRARKALAVMLRTAQAVAHTLDIDTLCHRLLELVFEAIEADRGCVMLMDPERQILVPRAVLHRRSGPQGRIAISRTILDYVVTHDEGVLTSDARDDQRWDSGASIVRQGIREAICVPMQGRYGTVGALYVDTHVRALESLEARSQRRFRDDHLELVMAIGRQAALAVEDTSYYSALVQAERLAAIGEAVATLSHHIKNILQGLKGGGFLIQEGIRQKDDQAIERGWKAVERNQDRIHQLVIDMLTVSKERTPTLAVARLDDVVDEVVELMQPAAANSLIQISRQTRNPIPAFPFDREGIHRAILNLVTNAIDACAEKEEGHIEIVTDWDHDQRLAIVEVIDDGPGIDPEDLERIFRPFESTKGHRGTGLGLPATRKILREHGGEVTVESQPGKGSRFRVQLPAPPETPPGPQSDPSLTMTF